MTNKEAAEIIAKYDVNGCGYCHQGGDEIPQAFAMAVEALERQEPRVMTPDEIRSAKAEPMWRETKSRHKGLYNGWVLIQKGMAEPSWRMYWKLDDYGRTWRCWTAEPNDEQREAVKWE